MKLEETIQYLFDKYPMLFRTREDCLNHLFCTPGNGFKWKDGELIEVSSLIYDSKTMKFKKEYKPTLKDGNRAKQMIIDKRYDKWRKIHPFVWNEVDDKHVQSYTYNYIYTYPKNIKKDWLDGINETKIAMGI